LGFRVVVLLHHARHKHFQYGRSAGSALSFLQKHSLATGKSERNERSDE
jgi:hypothetical protein